MKSDFILCQVRPEGNDRLNHARGRGIHHYAEALDRHHWGTGLRCSQSGQGTSSAMSPAGEISRTLEDISWRGELRWSTPTYHVSLAPAQSLPWTETCTYDDTGTQTSVGEGGIGGWSVNSGPESATLARRRPHGRQLQRRPNKQRELEHLSRRRGVLAASRQRKRAIEIVSHGLPRADAAAFRSRRAWPWPRRVRNARTICLRY